ncbi:hypothetical protein [Chromobacterium paludis]|uniref:Uncharacterized protein n=1 Tax=Chromobacterium paludis TaxID=2605945 RepID=A0A5C1DHY2_9NEIS|nr:hypothetical protein [Chromobacterium paludis]QEL56376.1 hypothetical protein FYK34_12815 [Chromobacterium paludis]
MTTKRHPLRYFATMDGTTYNAPYHPLQRMGYTGSQVRLIRKEIYDGLEKDGYPPLRLIKHEKDGVTYQIEMRRKKP